MVCRKSSCVLSCDTNWRMSCFVSNLASTWLPLRGIWKIHGIKKKKFFDVSTRRHVTVRTCFSWRLLFHGSALLVIDWRHDGSTCVCLGGCRRRSNGKFLVFIFRCSRASPPYNPLYVSRVDPSALAFSLSSHRHSYISLLFSFRFIV
jgi:hypothetical protein